MLHLRLFGAPTVRRVDSQGRDGDIVSFDTRKATALLAYLAVTGRPQSRDVLAALLWPELEQSKARGALRRTLSVASSVGEALVVEAKTVSVDPRACTCDVVQFREASGSDDVAAWRVAADLASEPFLAGFSLRDSSTFDDWQAMVGDELADQLSVLLGRLVTHASSTGDMASALEFARRRVHVDPLSEPAHVDVMRVLAESGDRSGALRQYRALVRVLDRELGVPPLPETIALQEEIRTGSLALTPAASSPGAAPSAPALREPERRPVRCVGRRAQRQQLLQAWLTASTAGVVRAVTGDPGMGRTTLMGAFADDVVTASDADPPLVVVLRGVASERGLAYAAAGDLVRALLEADPDLTTRLGEAGEALSALSPALGLPGGIENSAARRRVHESVRIALAARPAIVVVDDAHLIDAPSAELLGFVARRCPVGVLLVATWPTRAGSTGLVDAVREASDGARPILLTPLTASDVVELAGDEPLDADEVIGRTGGVPLLVAELVAQLMAERTASADGVDAVADVVAARLDAAPATTQQVVGASVVLGTVADPELLRATCGRDESETVDAIEDAVERGLLVERRELDGYDVPHALVRQAAMAQLGLARRRLLHGRAADTLARRHGVSPLVTPAGAVARHLVEAGRENEAGSWYWRAAQESLQLFAHAEAVDQLRTALALGYDASAVQPALGGALTRLGRYGEALLAFEQAAASVEDEPMQVAELELRIAEVHDRLGEWDLALDRISDAQRLVGSDTGLAARLETQAALTEYRLGRVDVAEQRARAASELAEVVGDPVAGARAANMLGVIAGARGSRDEALAHLQNAVQLARADGDHDLLVAGLNNLARALGRVDRDEDAVLAVQEAVALATAEGDRHHEAVLRSHLADLYHSLGDEAGSQEQQRASASAFAGVDSADTRPEVWTLVEW